MNSFGHGRKPFGNGKRFIFPGADFFISFLGISCISPFGKFLNSKIKTKNSKLVAALLDWFAANARDLPWRRTRDPYAIWVSEIMLQQTQVKTVIPFWNRWMKELPTIEAAAQAPSEKIHKLWEGLGYYTRVRNLQKAAQVIVEKHGGQFPENFDGILALPGIGRYTAGAIGSIAFNQPLPILDGNVIRVLTRIFGIAENPKDKPTNHRLWQLATELVFRAKAQSSQSRKLPAFAVSAPLREKVSCSFLNQSLMELGALVCTPRSPQCLVCPVKKLCVAFKAGRVDDWPNLGKREAATARHFIAFVIEQDGKFLVQQRPAGVVNAQLWEFPNEECAAARPALEAMFRRRFKTGAAKIQPLCTVKHSITRYRITLAAFVVRFKKDSAERKGIWKTPAQMQALAFTSAHRKVLNAVTAGAAG
jgi:A/G-specific adenine glycosylase